MPAVVVIVMAVCKCPSIPTLMVSALVAVVLAMLVQGQTLSGILNILDSGFSIDTALPEFNRLVNRGGLQSMLWTAALGILGMLYGSIMEKTGLLEALLSKMDPLVKSTGGLVTAVVLTCTLLLMVLPLIIRTAQEALRTIPAGQREASFGLGAGKGRTALHVLLPAAFPGMLAGILLAVGRITGESAALLFTAGTGGERVDSVFSSAATLAVALYAMMVEGRSLEGAYQTALVLLLLTAALNLCISLLMGRRERRER